MGEDAISSVIAGVLSDQAQKAMADAAPKPETAPPPKVSKSEARQMVETLAKGQKIETIRWKCKRDSWFFKKNFIKTVDEHDAEHPVKPIPMWPHIPYVTEAIAKNDIIIIEKARQVFITWTVLADLLHTALFQPHARIFVQSKKLAEACELVGMRSGRGSKFGRGRTRSMYDNLTPGLFPSAEWYHGEAQFSNGAVIKALASGEEQVREHTVTRFFADEAARIPEFEDTWIAARPSATGGGKMIAATTPKGKEAFYYLFKEFRGTGVVSEPTHGCRIEQCDDGVCLITLNWWVVPGRDLEWYKRATKGMPPAKARQEYDIDYGVFEGMPVYPQFRRNDHVEKLECRSDLPVIRGWDFGYKRAAVVYGQIIDRSLYILHMTETKQSSTKMLAQKVVNESDQFFHKAVFEDYCDSACIKDRGAGESTSLEILEAYPFHISPEFKYRRIMDGVDTISKLLQENRFRVHNSAACEGLVDAFAGGYAFKQTGEEPKKDGIHDHRMDAVRYLVDNTFDSADDPLPEVHLSEEKIIELSTKRVYDKCRREREEWQAYSKPFRLKHQRRRTKQSPDRPRATRRGKR